MKRVMISEVTTIMEQDLFSLSKLRTTLQLVFGHWKLWNLQLIGNGLDAADSETLIDLWYFIKSSPGTTLRPLPFPPSRHVTFAVKSTATQQIICGDQFMQGKRGRFGEYPPRS